MQNNTHAAVLTDEEGRAIAFIDGIPDTCEHDDNGEWLHFNSEGEYFKESELPPNELNAGRNRYKFFVLHAINGGCCSCSKCGKPYTPDFFNMP